MVLKTELSKEHCKKVSVSIHFLTPGKLQCDLRKQPDMKKMMILPKNYTQTVKQISVTLLFDIVMSHCLQLQLSACNGYTIITCISNVSWFLCANTINKTIHIQWKPLFHNVTLGITVCWMFPCFLPIPCLSNQL
jgi:hypothetical protein